MLLGSCAGLSVEHSREQALQTELSLVQAEEAALPLKISKLQEALNLEQAELQRRETGIPYTLAEGQSLFECQTLLDMLLQQLARKSLPDGQP